MLVSLTVGKVDAGVAVLLTEDKRLIEFPSILLPPDIHSGSIVDINVSRNHPAELLADQNFSTLQTAIFTTFASVSPSPPILRCRNATQTSVVLEWDTISLATAELRSLSLYRNGAKAGNIPVGKLSTKISGLALDTEYTFHLVLRTSAGQYSSERVTVKTHKMTDLHGITITPGVMPPQLRDSLAETVGRIGAKVIDGVRIDTTHFVCTEPRGQAWEKAVEMNVPVVVPDWVKGCEREGRIVGVRAYYLDADPSKRQIGPSAAQQQQEAERRQERASVSSVPMRDSPRIEHTPPTPEQARPGRGFPEVNGTPSAQQTIPETPAATAPQEVADEAEPAETNGRSAEGASLAGTTLAEKEVDGDEEEEEEEEESEDDEATEKGAEGGEVEKSKAQDVEQDGQEETSLQEAAQMAEEDGKFDEVDL